STDRQTGARFGASVAFSGNNELIVGEYGRNGTNPNVIGAGRAYVYVVANDGNATLRQIINNPEPGDDDFFGWTVTGDGTQIAIAAIYDDIGTGVNLVDRAGAIYMYEKDAANQYTFTQKITASNPRQSALYGNSMALQNDVLIVGAPDESTQFTNGVQSYGAAYAYKNINGTWQESDRFLPQGLVPGGRFGWSVSLDNNQVLISHHKGSNPSSVFNGPGIVFLYQLDPITGTRTQTSIVESPFPATSAAFGLSCVIQNGLISVGAFGDITDLQGVYDVFNVGAVYTYATSSTASMNEQDREVVTLYPNPATDFIRLQTTGTGTYRIQNTLGQEVLQGSYEANDQPISITRLKTGLFFITLETAG
ncbi:MAG: T9SS type A sorting domain-containing protein, partial [Nonlabens sp.]|nr:T9SS type A sorting domain-containing protein [Nonlabens sp.]